MQNRFSGIVFSESAANKILQLKILKITKKAFRYLFITDCKQIIPGEEHTLLQKWCEMETYMHVYVWTSLKKVCIPIKFAWPTFTSQIHKTCKRCRLTVHAKDWFWSGNEAIMWSSAEKCFTLSKSHFVLRSWISIKEKHSRNVIVISMEKIVGVRIRLLNWYVPYRN